MNDEERMNYLFGLLDRMKLPPEQVVMILRAVVKCWPDTLATSTVARLCALTDIREEIARQAGEEIRP